MKPMIPAASFSTWASRSVSRPQRYLHVRLPRPHGLLPAIGWLLMLANPMQVVAQQSDPVARAQSRLLNINTASAAELDALPGIGPAKAQAIVAYRRKHGPFATPADLVQVKGIGPGITARLYPLVTTQGTTTATMDAMADEGSQDSGP